ncbi:MULTISPECIES: aspartate/glutamate racemase family protein [unclassified Caballeronia]|uniref:aspartate/glutamate racemase family protein n=1 Tax=unclassified Caballeronia TaxID=2646786 RepID=UPI001FD5631B|nr:MULTISPECIES: aspartate/glutamate racemase family protein [unclassified Caballeronia]MDR5773126.1 aspartate/glutamate racemase family protein [Caballeronia sp. LZ002]MDR5848560.1 aspartate/glutamate racemase family protein [Caballeronia sp. LZ003]
MPKLIHFLNPNGLATVTREIEKTVCALRGADDAPVCFETLFAVDGGIETQRDADRAAVAVAEYVARHEASASAFVIACYSDPGLHAARELTQQPVLGIGAAAMGVALARGSRIGVIAASTHGMPRHWRSYHAARIAQTVAGERAVNLGVAESGNRDAALDKLIATGRALCDEDGADVIVLGCAGMTPLRADIEAALGVPVIDPCSTAASLAFAICRERQDPWRPT